MQEVKHRIFLLGVVLVAVRSIDGQTTVHTQNLTVIPGVAHGAVLELGLTVVFRTLAGNQEHGEETGAVTLNEDVLRVVHVDTIYYKVIGVDFRRGQRNLHGPDIVFSTFHVDGARPGVLHPRATEFDNGGVICLEAEGHAVVLDLRGNDGFHATAKREVGQFLCLQATGNGQADGKRGKDTFH